MTFGQDHPTTQSTDTDIAVGVPMFSREEALRTLFESLPTYVSTVYVADNGRADDRDIYHDSWPFDVAVDHLEFDCGIGPCRANIAERCEEPYLFVCDSDMEVTRPDDLRVLRSILTEHDGLGAVSGWLNEGNTVRTGARDLHEYRDIVIKDVTTTPEITQEPYPHARFEFIPQAALYRTAIFDDYSYDPEIFNSEHLDFFLGHRDADEWTFASTPAVLIQHHKGIDSAYRQSKRGKNRVDFDVINAKWGYRWALPGARSDWISTRDKSDVETLFNVFRRIAPACLWVPLRNTWDKIPL